LLACFPSTLCGFLFERRFYRRHRFCPVLSDNCRVFPLRIDGPIPVVTRGLDGSHTLRRFQSKFRTRGSTTVAHHLEFLANRSG
jgi:hypothetical protein